MTVNIKFYTLKSELVRKIFRSIGNKSDDILIRNNLILNNNMQLIQYIFLCEASNPLIYN